MRSQTARSNRASAVRHACILFAAGLAVVCVNGVHPVLAQDTRKLPLTKYVHRSWAIDEGLPQGSVQAILQASDGYIWLGTQEGLVRFDGHSFDVFDELSSPALWAKDVANLVEDSQGNLWVGSRTGGLVRYDGTAFYPATSAATIPTDRVESLAAGHDGSLLVGTAEGGLYKLSAGRSKAKELVAPGGSVVSAVLAASDGSIWIGTVSGRITRLPAGDTTAAAHLPIDSGTVNDIAEDRDGAILVATTGSGVYRLAHDLSGGPIKQTIGLDVTALNIRPDGSILAGTARRGLMHIDHHRTDWFAPKDGLPYAGVLSIMVDREDNLWVGTDGGGVTRLYRGQFASYSAADGLPEGSVYAVFEDQSGSLWLGTENGVARRRDDEITVFGRESGLPQDAIISIAQTGDGSLWLGSHASGLYQFQNGQVVAKYNTTNGLPGDGIFALYSTSSGVLYIATSNGVAVRRNESFHPLSDSPLPSKLVTAFAGDDHDLWLGTYDAGLVRVTDGRVVHTTDAEIDRAILSMYLDNESTLWIGTWGGGLARLKDGKLNAITTKSGSFNDFVFQILEDDSQHLWLSCNKGIWRLSKPEIEQFLNGTTDEVKSTVYDGADGLLSREFNGGYQPAGWKGADGKLWFPSQKGATVVDPAAAGPTSYRLPVYVTEINIGDTPISVDANVSVPPGEKRLEVSYVGLTYRVPEKVRYRYRLDGADDDWIDAGQRRTAFYTNLAPGGYSFSVQARLPDGPWYDSAPVTIRLEPFFYQTWWFYFLIAVGIALAAAGVHRWKLRSLRLRKVELERLVDEQTRDLRIEKERTEEAKHIIEKQAAGLAESNEEKSQILRVVAHDLRNPLNVIREFAASLTEELSNQSAVKQTRLIHSSADRMLNMVAKLLQSARLESGRVEVHRTAFAAKDVAVEAIRTNQIYAIKKSQRILMASVEADATVVHADRDLLLEAIDNLISNAVKYSPESSDIRVRVSCNDKHVRISVEDDGPGISEQEQSRLFRSFQKGAAKPTGGESSTGLGLAIVKKLVELNGGTISLTSELGSGSSFTIELGRSTTTTRQPRQSREPVARSPKQPGVLGAGEPPLPGPGKTTPRADNQSR